MKTIPPTLQFHLNSELTTLAVLLKVTRSDGMTIGFTTHDRNIQYAGTEYQADGLQASKPVDSAATLKAKALDVVGVLDNDGITEADIRAGLYDHARIDIYMVNWQDASAGAMQLRRGWLGEIATAGSHYTAELRGLHDLLQRRIGEIYSPECRYDLGETRCSVNLAALTVSGAVTAVEDASVFADASRGEPAGYFNYGKLRWTSGANTGAEGEVQQWSDHTFRLWLPCPNVPEVGDTYEVFPGCDKRFATCGDKFANRLNFGGFPHLPGVGKVLRYPG